MSDVKITCWECGEPFKLHEESGSYACRCGHFIHVYVDGDPIKDKDTAAIAVFDEPNGFFIGGED